jgi:hypothetical protein
MAKDPKKLNAINTVGPNHHINSIEDSEGRVWTYQEVVDEIRGGRPFSILDEDDNPSGLEVTPDGTIRTTKDASELNNLRGNTNLKENWSPDAPNQ